MWYSNDAAYDCLRLFSCNFTPVYFFTGQKDQTAFQINRHIRAQISKTLKLIYKLSYLVILFVHPWYPVLEIWNSFNNWRWLFMELFLSLLSASHGCKLFFNLSPICDLWLIKSFICQLFQLTIVGLETFRDRPRSGSYFFGSFILFLVTLFVAWTKASFHLKPPVSWIWS